MARLWCGCATLFLAGMLAVPAPAAERATRPVATAEAIQREALREPFDAEGLPLPLVGSWNCGAAALTLPVSFLSTQWDVVLTVDRKYRDVPPEQDPNILDADGKTVRDGVDAFGPIEPWRQAAGRRGPVTRRAGSTPCRTCGMTCRRRSPFTTGT